jgi:putative transposase
VGTKRSVVVEADGGSLAVVITGANLHDTKLLEKTLEAIIVKRPNHKQLEQHLCLDKGYENPTGRAVIEKHQYIPYIRKIGEAKWNENQRKVYPALAVGGGTDA